jgi:hypothetical protein
VPVCPTYEPKFRCVLEAPARQTRRETPTLAYHLDLFSPAYEPFSRSGRTVSGFVERQRHIAELIQPNRDLRLLHDETFSLDRPVEIEGLTRYNETGCCTYGSGRSEHFHLDRPAASNNRLSLEAELLRHSAYIGMGFWLLRLTYQQAPYPMWGKREWAQVTVSGGPKANSARPSLWGMA